MKVITTVGTSIFENYFKDDKNKKEEKLRKEYEHIVKHEDNSFSNSLHFKSKSDRIEEAIKKWYNHSNASAEINSILKIAEETNENIEVHLIATDTVLSVLAAELIYNWFQENKPSNIEQVDFVTPNIDFENQEDTLFVIKKLRVNSSKNYEKGFMNLIEVLDKLHEKDKTILNITGGYKAIIPIMTIYGQLKKIPLKYIYNESELYNNSELITVNSLPFSFDWAKIELYHYFLKKENRKSLSNFPDLKLELESQKLISTKGNLTVLGELFWSYIDNTPYSFNVFGLFVEYKIYEALIEHSIDNFNDTPILNLTYYLDVETETNTIRTIPLDEVGKRLYHPIEYDLILSSKITNECAIMEVKSFSQASSIKDLIKKTKWKIYTKNKLDEKQVIKEFILVIHKFENQNLKSLNKSLQRLSDEINPLPLKVYYVDIKVDWEKVKINYTSFMKDRLEFGKSIKLYSF